MYLLSFRWYDKGVKNIFEKLSPFAKDLLRIAARQKISRSLGPFKCSSLIRCLFRVVDVIFVFEKLSPINTQRAAGHERPQEDKTGIWSPRNRD